MPESDPTEVRAFISYGHADSTIADAVHAELIRLAEKGRGKSALHCFLDTKDIDPGKRWEPVIIEELEAADWLIVLFTGDQSAYCGFEIGWYSRVNGLLGPAPIRDKRLVSLHDIDVEALPPVLKPYQGKKILFDKDHLDLQSVTEGQQNDFWNTSPIAQFLRDFCKYKKLYEPNPEKPEEFKADIIQSAKEITKSFLSARSTDEIAETPCQLSIQIKSKPGSADGPFHLAKESLVIGNSKTFDIFDINLPSSATKAPN